MAVKPLLISSRHHSTARACKTAALCLLVLCGALVASPAWSQEVSQAGPSLSEIQLVREGFRAFVGVGTLGGNLDFRSSTANMQADLGQIPSLTVGLQGWLDENAGFDVAYQASFLGELAVPLDSLQGQALGVNANRLESAFRYRFFTGPRQDSLSFGARVGFLLHNLTPSPHTPTIVLSTTYFGPLLGLTARLPLTWWLGLEAEGSFILPFNVREFPDRSGSPKNPLGYHGGAAVYVRTTAHLYLRLRYDYRQLQAEFSGQGNRGLGGVTNAVIFDQFHSPQLQAEWIF